MALQESTTFLQLVTQFRQFADAQLPALRQEVNKIINNQETDTYTIELYLSLLLALTKFGVGEELFNCLQQYYKRINHWGFIVYQALAAQYRG